MKFGSALEALKGGSKVARTGWDGKNMHLRMFRTEGQVGEFLRVPVIAIFTTDGVYRVWSAAQADLIEEDWEAL